VTIVEDGGLYRQPADTLSHVASGVGPASRPAQLPCWQDLPPDLQKKRVEEIAHEIEEETKVRLDEKGVPPLGPDAIRRQSPDTIPPRSKKSPAPLFLAASKRVRDDLRNAYYSFLAAFREAADELKAGNRNALFPEGSFPPAMPFVSG
jgi:hypothetical protein